MTSHITSNLNSCNRAGRRRPPRALTRAEMDELFRAAGGAKPGWLGTRNRAAVVLWWRCGLRVSESLALLTRDIDLTRGEVHVRDGKGHKARTVGIDPLACDVIERWLVVRGVHNITSKATVLCRQDGEQWDDDGARAMLRRAGIRAGIEKDVSPHILRHTMTVEMVREGVPMMHVSKQLGHANVSTTHHYANHLAPDEVIDSVRARSW